jgi:putative DNA primase/helicase
MALRDDGGGPVTETADHHNRDPHRQDQAAEVHSNGNGRGVANATEEYFAKLRARLGIDAAAYVAPPKDRDDDPQDLDSPPDDDESPPRLEDAHIGAWIATHHLQRFLYAGGLGWLKYDGCRWKPVEEITVSEVVRQALIEFHRSEAQSGAEPGRLQQISRMLSANRIRAITYITKMRRATKEVFGTEAAFDARPDLLNVGNGVVDLHTGTRRPHDPGLLFTKVTMVDYVPGATHPDWQKALTALPADAADWLQIRMGQGLTGHQPPDDVMVVLKGSGANGKTTIVDGVREAVGADYAVTLPERVLLARTGDHPTELMTLRGARLGLMEEFPELGHLNVKRLKDLHGVGEMTARYCGRDTVYWKPSHTIFVTTNYLPRVDESDYGTWRRLALVDFPYRYRKAHESKQTAFDRVGDPTLRQRVRLGADGRQEAVLAWLIDGAVKWYRNGQVMPQAPGSVEEATAAWRGTSDLLMRYMNDNLVFDGKAYVMSVELFEDFNAWLNANGHVPWSDQSLSARLGQHPEALAHRVEKKPKVRASRPGLSRHRGGGKPPPQQFSAWLGIRFRTPDDDEEISDDLGK